MNFKTCSKIIFYQSEISNSTGFIQSIGISLIQSDIIIIESIFANNTCLTKDNNEACFSVLYV